MAPGSAVRRVLAWAIGPDQRNQRCPAATVSFISAGRSLGSENACGRPNSVRRGGLASLTVYIDHLRMDRRTPFWELPTPTLADSGDTIRRTKCKFTQGPNDRHDLDQGAVYATV
jgi:hypothetical protein